jgi:hypothetical protein
MDFGRTTVMGASLPTRYQNKVDLLCSSFGQYCDMPRQFDPTPSPPILPDGTVIPAYAGPGVDIFVRKFGREDLLTYSQSSHYGCCALPSYSNLSE